MFHSNTERIIVNGLCIKYNYMYISIYQNINITKKICCIKIFPTDCFACKAHQGTQQLKKATLFTLKEIKKAKIKS